MSLPEPAATRFRKVAELRGVSLAEVLNDALDALERRRPSRAKPKPEGAAVKAKPRVRELPPVAPPACPHGLSGGAFCYACGGKVW